MKNRIKQHRPPFFTDIVPRGTFDEINSVKSPPAQSPEVLHGNSKVDLFREKVETFCSANVLYPLRFRYLVWILLHSGCRVSEVLRLRDSDVTGNYLIRIRASKGSEDRIVTIPPLGQGKLIGVKSNAFLFDSYSRFYVYRVCKSHGLYIKKGDLEHYSVTHSFRHVYANQIQQLAKGDSVASRAMGHKNSKSIKYYDY